MCVYVCVWSCVSVCISVLMPLPAPNNGSGERFGIEGHFSRIIVPAEVCSQKGNVNCVSVSRCEIRCYIRYDYVVSQPVSSSCVLTHAASTCLLSSPHP